MENKKWWALLVLCLGVLMEVLDTTIVNVALPSIRVDLGFTQTSLAWIVNAYMLTFGGFLLLSGRLGDLYGNRRLFLIGISVFTLASLACGLSFSQEMLIIARAIQGLGAATASAVSLALIMNLFPEPGERARALGVFGFVASGGGALGVLLGGFLTGTFNWHWIFLINIPIGILVFILCMRLLPHSPREHNPAKLDVTGALLITVAMLLAVYAIVNGNVVGWTSAQTLGLLSLSVLGIIAFIFVESRVDSPLMPLGLFRSRNVSIANVVGVLWAGAMFAWFFISALYLQLVLNYTPMKVGLTFLPANIIMAIFSIWLSAKLVMRFGIKKPLAVGLFIASIGLALLAKAPVNGQFLGDILPSMILLGIGAGMAFNPMLLAAMNDVPQNEAGLASGLVNTSFMMGGALGLAVLASIAAIRTEHLLKAGADNAIALNGGYHLAFIVGGIFAFLGATLSALLLKSRPVHEGHINH
jgi:EmrB/QacA subfamily drug resistance transporter